MGNIEIAPDFYRYDSDNFGNYYVNVFDYGKMEFDEIDKIVNSTDTTICAWCFSEMNPAIRFASEKGGLKGGV